MLQSTGPQRVGHDRATEQQGADRLTDRRRERKRKTDGLCVSLGCGSRPWGNCAFVLLFPRISSVSPCAQRLTSSEEGTKASYKELKFEEKKSM